MNEPVISETRGNQTNEEYGAFLHRLQLRFLENTASSALFTTDAEGLWDAYLGSFGPKPAEGEEKLATVRQFHTCHACRHFITRFGGLVTLTTEGQAKSAIWNEEDAPNAYKPAFAEMTKRVHISKVTGVFLSEDKVWGTPKTGAWQHLAVTPAPSMVWDAKKGLLNAHQAGAAKAEDFKTVMHALNEFTQPHLELALTLLKTDALYRSEKVLGQAQWLHDLHVARAAARGTARAKVVWYAIAAAPAGFCHPRSSMIGTLLEDIAAGMEFGEASKRFAAKMHPLAYQRPQAAPAAGAIAAAEKVLEKLGAAGSLARRFARLEDVQALWKPAAPDKMEEVGKGVFGHLKPKGAAVDAPRMKVPVQTMTWEKFQRDVLPTAEHIEFFTTSGYESYTSLVTAVNPDAPPILQWDTEEKRNPVSWYVYNGGSPARQFGLEANKFYKVNALALKPSMWNGGYEHQGVGVVIIIDGAKDSRDPSLALFPEILKSEFHGIRSVIEAYSKSRQLEGQDEQSAAGMLLYKGQTWNALLRVTSRGSVLEYKLDRWD